MTLADDEDCMRWLVVVVVVSGCTYYTLPPDEARRVAAMGRAERESTTIEATRDDGKTVSVNPRRLKLLKPWHDGQPMYVRRSPNAALVSGAVIVVVGIAFVVPGAVVTASPVNDARAGNCDICAFSYGYGQSMVGGALLGVGVLHVAVGGVALLVGGVRETRD